MSSIALINHSLYPSLFVLLIDRVPRGKQLGASHICLTNSVVV